MKRKILFLSAVMICLAILSAGTIAYFNAEDTAHNVITTGGVNIEVLEQMRDGNTLVDFPSDGISGVMPGSAVSKIVRVKNTGAADAWIRVKVSETVESADGTELPLTLNNGADVMTFSLMNGWVDGNDGYYYFNRPIAAQQMTDVLFDEVYFSEAMGNEYQSCTANILINAQAVQSANNAIPSGGSVTDILGWPEE